MIIERLNSSNVDSALDLCEACFGEDCNDFNINSVLTKADKYNYCFVAKDKDLVVGLIVATPVKTPFDIRPMIYISYVCTHEQYRRQGIALALVEYAVSYCRKKLSAKEFLLHTLKGDEAADAVYRKAGFTDDVNGFYLHL